MRLMVAGLEDRRIEHKVSIERLQRVIIVIVLIKTRCSLDHGTCARTISDASGMFSEQVRKTYSKYLHARSAKWNQCPTTL